MNNCSVCGSNEMYCEHVPFRSGMDICAVRCAECYNFVCAPRSYESDIFHAAKELWNAQSGAKAAPTQVETQGWQPIETAPKDGMEILLSNGETVAQGNWLHAEPYIKEKRDLEGRYIDQDEFDGYEGWIDQTGGMQPEPTHWMPLPAAPSQGEKP